LGIFDEKYNLDSSFVKVGCMTEIIVGKAIIPYDKSITLITNFRDEVDPTNIKIK